MPSFNKFVFAGAALIGSLLAFQIGFSGEPPSAGEGIPADKLAAYSEVSAAIAAHPEMSPQDMEALLREHELSADEYERIDQGAPVQSAPQTPSDVKAKQKETTP
jgi:hypothetical protein